MKLTYSNIDQIFKQMLFRPYGGGSGKLIEGFGASGHYLHGSKSKISLWDSKTGKTIGYIKYQVKKPGRKENPTGGLDE